MNTTVNRQDIEHFSADSDKWWDETGPFAPLHRLNPARMGYLKSTITSHFDLDPGNTPPLKDISIIDVGCGGGLVCEPLARLGANITGLDADENAVNVAKNHAGQMGLDISYLAASTTSHLETDKNRGAYDVVLALEIIEHVDNRQQFVREVFELCKPGGLVIFSTLNRTAKSFALGIVAAEYILRWVPQGTHSWKKFVKPSELSSFIRKAGGTPIDIHGLIYDIKDREFRLDKKDLDVNYFLSARKA